MNRILKFLLLICAGTLLTACSPDLPECDATEVESTLQKLLKPYIPKGTKVTFESFNENYHAGEADNEIRFCTAYAANGESLNFKISWQNRENAMFYVEMLDDNSH